MLNMNRRLIIGPLILGLALAGCARPPQGPPDPVWPSASAGLGAALAERHCGSCHATGRTGASPFAAAPPFREVALRYPPSSLQEGLAEGLVTAHPAMPAFAFEAADVNHLIAYLESF
jgi:mono/diheme cytochrome c family protein